MLLPRARVRVAAVVPFPPDAPPDFDDDDADNEPSFLVMLFTITMVCLYMVLLPAVVLFRTVCAIIRLF